jgi:hypothetical protein
LVAKVLEMVAEIVTAAIVVEASVAATRKVLHEALDFAFLDVDVTDGKTFEVAQILERKRVPSCFGNQSPLAGDRASRIRHSTNFQIIFAKGFRWHICLLHLTFGLNARDTVFCARRPDEIASRSFRTVD